MLPIIIGQYKDWRLFEQGPQGRVLDDGDGAEEDGLPGAVAIFAVAGRRENKLGGLEVVPEFLLTFVIRGEIAQTQGCEGVGDVKTESRP